MKGSFRSITVGISIAAAFILSASPVRAVPVVDGTKDVAYGAALAVQTVQTQFGDNLSEWNAGYATIDSGRLFLMLTGNIEDNFNKLEIFIDSKAGGQGVFDSADNDNAANMDGLVFDTGFTADYHLILRRGASEFNLDFADLVAGTFSSYIGLFGGASVGVASTGTGINGSAIGVGYNNSNVAGILGGIGAADQTAAQAVMTGLELSIALADLGATGDIRVMVGQNNSNHNFWSNQFLGGLEAPQGNLGGDGLGNFDGFGDINMTNFAGNQFFTIESVPIPPALWLFGSGILGLIGVARRKV